MIRFSKHAEDKFEILKKHGLDIDKDSVLNTVSEPETIDTKSRKPLIVTQSNLDESRMLRVLYRVESGVMFVITFYPVKKANEKQYENFI